MRWRADCTCSSETIDLPSTASLVGNSSYVEEMRNSQLPKRRGKNRVLACGDLREDVDTRLSQEQRR